MKRVSFSCQFEQPLITDVSVSQSVSHFKVWVIDLKRFMSVIIIVIHVYYLTSWGPTEFINVLCSVAGHRSDPSVDYGKTFYKRNKEATWPWNGLIVNILQYVCVVPVLQLGVALQQMGLTTTDKQSGVLKHSSQSCIDKIQSSHPPLSPPSVWLWVWWVFLLSLPAI